MLNEFFVDPSVLTSLLERFSRKQRLAFACALAFRFRAIYEEFTQEFQAGDITLFDLVISIAFGLLDDSQTSGVLKRLSSKAKWIEPVDDEQFACSQAVLSAALSIHFLIDVCLTDRIAAAEGISEASFDAVIDFNEIDLSISDVERRLQHAHQPNVKNEILFQKQLMEMIASRNAVDINSLKKISSIHPLIPNK